MMCSPRCCSLFTTLLLFPLTLLAQEEKPAEPELPRIEKTGATTYSVEGLSFDAKTREIRVPTKMNIRDGGPLEYVLVQNDGKIHESLLNTVINPMTLQIVMKLLRYESGMGDVLAPMLPEDERAEAEAKVDERGETINFFVEWEGKKIPVEEWVVDAKSRGPIDAAAADWIYTGSYFSDAGGFMAQVEGSIVAMYLDRGALFNTPLEGSDDDERWGANGKVTPELGTPLTLIIRPEKKVSQTDSKNDNE